MRVQSKVVSLSHLFQTFLEVLKEGAVVTEAGSLFQHLIILTCNKKSVAKRMSYAKRHSYSFFQLFIATISNSL